MLWLDIIDIIYLVIGIIVGFVICSGIHKDECDNCVYSEIIEEMDHYGRE